MAVHRAVARLHQRTPVGNPVSLASEHADVVRGLQSENPTPLVFTVAPGTAETHTPARTLVPGSQVTCYCQDTGGGDPLEYERLGLTVSEAPRLFGSASVLGEYPPENSRVMFAGEPMRVRSVKPFRRNQIVFTFYVIIS